MRVTKRYGNGAVRAEFEGVEFTAGTDRGISWMSDWGVALDWDRRGIFSHVNYGPSTFGQVDYFLGECYAHVLPSNDPFADAVVLHSS